MSQPAATTSAVPAEYRSRPGDEQLIAALVSGATYGRAAELADCSIATVKRRLNEPGFRLRLIEAKNDALDRLLGANLNGAMLATSYLVTVVRDEGQATVHRIRAAIALRDVASLDRHVNERH